MPGVCGHTLPKNLSLGQPALAKLGAYETPFRSAYSYSSDLRSFGVVRGSRFGIYRGISDRQSQPVTDTPSMLGSCQLAT